MTILRLLFFLVYLHYSPIPAPPTDIYFAQSSAGGNTGADCADARAWSTASASDWVAGNTLHHCGTFAGTTNSTAIASKGAGGVGNPVILKFESGAVLQAPAWAGSTNGAITITHANVTIDGGANGTIQNTLNGDSGNTNCLGGTCTVQQANTMAVYTSGANTIIQNLHITHMCMHTFSTDGSGGGDNGFFRGNCVGVQSAGTNTLMTENTVDNTASGLVCTQSGCEISFNTVTATSRATIISMGTGTQLTGIKIHNNDWSDPWVWDEGTQGYHHNGLHAFTATGIPGSGMAGTQIYYNYCHGTWSHETVLANTHVTACVFINDAGAENKISGTAIFRNVAIFDSSVYAASWPSDGPWVNGACTLSSCTPTTADLTLNNTAITSHGPQCFDLGDISDTSSSLNNICETNGGGGVWHTTYPYPSSQVDYNLYAGVSLSASVFPLVNSSQAQVIGNWNSNWPHSPYNFDLHGGIPTIAAINLDATGHPLSGSVAIGAATNLTSTYCGTLPALCVGAPSSFGVGSTNNGVALPSVGNWDTGAYPASSGSASFVPSTLNFGQINKGASSAPVNNSLFTMAGSGTATFSSEVFSGPNAADFSLSTNGCNFPTGSVSAPGTCSVAIVFSPTAAVGTVETATFTVSYSGLTGSPATITLTGISGATAPSPASFAGTLNASGTLVGAN